MGSVEAVQSEDITRSEREEASTESQSGPYEPPMLVRVGSLRTLLGKSGFIPDKTPPFELRE